MVLCCICGVEIVAPIAGARCPQCLQREVDITEGITRRIHIQRCGTCSRFNKPPWAPCELESRELLSLCLRHVKGLTREHQLVDASFIWTEPHSKELKVKMVLRKEAIPGVVVEQTMVVEFRVDDKQCPDCQKSYTRHTWESCVQVRQRSEHRRTLLRLEQLIVQNGVHKQLIGLEQTKDGIDFFFMRQSDAQAFCSFVKTWAVVKHHDSKHLVSHNQNNNTYRFKKTICMEICPVCRDDIVFLPPKVAQALGGLPPLMLCTRATSVIGLIDPVTMRSVEIPGAEYWKRPFTPVCTSSHLKEFIVLDVTTADGFEATGKKGPVACDVEVARASDFGKNDERMVLRSHLGAILHPSDEVLGFDLRSLNTGLDEAELGEGPSQEVYLVRQKRAPRAERRKGKHSSTADAASEAVDPDGGADGDAKDGTEAAEDEPEPEVAEAAARFWGALGNSAEAEGTGEAEAEGGAAARAAPDGGAAESPADTLGEATGGDGEAGSSPPEPPLAASESVPQQGRGQSRGGRGARRRQDRQEAG
mmetsp:Transcript_36599/g.80159  ORF Transcript_36599/g.80159 Transcript_36599/m.80159 type:complete len:533 (+) Transcript_36599:77-1675(+)